MKRLICLIMILTLMLSAVPALAYEELAKGSKGDAVVEIQERLNELGYSVGTADGDFGNKTYNAIVSYQTDRGLDATGIATVELQGMIENDVLYLGRLNQLGYAGAELRNIAAKYQEYNGLEVTGLLDEATMHCIDSEIEKIERMEAIVADLVLVDGSDAGNVGCYGYASIATGEIVIPCEWTDIGKFSEGLAYVCKDDKYGYIDIEGTVIIPTEYEKVADFHEGLAAVSKDGKWGYIDKTGNVVIDLIYEYVHEFSEGLAPIQLEDLWGYINKSGELVLNNQWERAGCFYDGMAIVQNDKNADYGVIDTDGNFIIPMEYDDIWRAGERLFRVETIRYNWNYDRIFEQGVIDVNGKNVIPIAARTMPNGFSEEGLTLVRANDKYGYIDGNGNEIIPCTYYEASAFSEGVAAVCKEKGHYYYIDTTGEKAIYPDGRWNIAENFSNGLAYVEDFESNMAGFINMKGELVIAMHPDAESNSTFGIGWLYYAFSNNGVCAVVLPDAETLIIDDTKYARISYINTKGEIVVENAGWNKIKYKPEDNSAPKYNMKECQDIAVNALKKRLKNPASLQVHNVSCTFTEDDNNLMFTIDFSAMNSLGGYSRETCYCIVDAATGIVTSIVIV